MRTSHLGPRYAVFSVPLHFNKLDMRDYLKSVYNVDVLHVRSTIIQAKINTKRTLSKTSNGYYVRSASQKKMTVLLAKPFVYPEEIKDLSP
jgi:large subunit ribosomal protein L23